MRVALFYYDGFAEFEIVLVSMLFHHHHEMTSIALEAREYRSEEHQRFLVDHALREVEATSIDLLVIPGGDPAPLVEDQELKRFIGSLLQAGKKVGGICGGASLLAGLGFLKGKRCTGDTSGVEPGTPEAKYYEGAIVCDEQVVVDGNLVTAQGQAYAEFAVELARQARLYEDPGKFEEVLKWCKNLR